MNCKTLYLVGRKPSYRGQLILEQALRDAGVAKWELVSHDPYISRPHPHADIIVTLGDDALDQEVPDAPRAIEARGYFWDIQETDFHGDYRVMASMHPDDCDTQWVPYRKLLEIDLKKAKAELDAGCLPLPERRVEIITDEQLISNLWSAVYGSERIALDIENDRELNLSCLGIGISPTLAYVIPAGEPWQMDAIKAICESTVPKVLQNGQYDATFLKYRNNIALNGFCPPLGLDAMLLWHSYMIEIAGGKEDAGKKKKAFRKTEKSLRFLASIFCRVYWWKDYQYEHSEDQYILCGKDNCLTLEIAEKLEELIA